jgi:hypothetical protein
MIKKQTWVILAVFVVLLGALIVIPKLPKPKGADTTTLTVAPAKTILDSSIGAFKAMRLTKVDGSSIALSLGSDNTWHVDEPVKKDADPSGVQEIVSTVQALQAISTLTSPPPDGATGLAAPMTLSITTVSNTSVTLKIGNKTPTGNGYYINAGQSDVYIADSYSIDRIVELFNGNLTPTETPTSNSPADATGSPEAQLTQTPVETLPPEITPSPTVSK